MKNMKLRHIVALLFVGTFASSCVSGALVYGYKQYNDSHPLIANEIEILDHVPARPFHTIAEVKAMDTHQTTLSNLVARIKVEAESLGADAIIPTQNSGNDSPITVVYHSWLDTFHRHASPDAPIITGVAIKYD